MTEEGNQKARKKGPLRSRIWRKHCEKSVWRRKGRRRRSRRRHGCRAFRSCCRQDMAPLLPSLCSSSLSSFSLQLSDCLSVTTSEPQNRGIRVRCLCCVNEVLILCCSFSFITFRILPRHPGGGPEPILVCAPFFRIFTLSNEINFTKVLHFCSQSRVTIDK